MLARFKLRICWMLLLAPLSIAFAGCEGTPNSPTSAEAEQIGANVDTLLAHARNLIPSGNYANILDTLDKALALCTRHWPEIDPHLGSVYYFIGNIQRRAGRINRSLAAYRKGWALTCGQPDSMASKALDLRRFSLALGNQFSRQLMADSALYYGRFAAALTRELDGDSSVRYSEILQNLGIYAVTAGRYDTAVALSREALKVARYRGSLSDVAVAEINLADAHTQSGALNSGERYYRKALEHLEGESGNTAYFRAMALCGLAGCLARKGAAVVADGYFQSAITLMEADTLNPQPRELAKVRLEYGRFLQATGRSGDALALLQASMEDFFRGWKAASLYAHPPLHLLEREPYAFEVLTAQAGCMAALGPEKDLDSAFATYRHAFRFADQIRRGFATVDEKLGLMHLTYPQYDRAIDLALALDAGHPDGRYGALAFEWIERSKANDLLDQLVDLERYQLDLLPDWAIDSGRALESRILQAEAAVLTGDKAAAATLQQLQTRKSKLVGALRAWHPGYFYQEPPFADAEAVRCSLANSEAVFVSYFLGRDHVHVSAVSVGGDTSFVVPDAVRVMRESNQVIKWIRDGNDIAFHAYDSVAAHLYASLLAPVFAMKGLGGGIPERIVIAPDGGLAFLPFEALVTEPLPPGAPIDWAAPAYLVQQSVVSYIQSGSLFAAPARKMETPKQGVFGMGMGYEQSGLLKAADEVEMAVSLLHGEAVIDEEATESRLKLEGTVWEILHLAAHGIMDPRHPLQGFIQLLPDAPAEDGHLHLHEVLKLRLAQRLAVLSACSTGDGAAIPGSGVLSMGLAFQIAGCPAVVQSLSGVDDQATARLMRHFYAQLADGKTTAVALTVAKRAILGLASGKQAGVQHHYLQHPFYWALFVLTGEDDLRQK